MAPNLRRNYIAGSKLHSGCHFQPDNIAIFTPHVVSNPLCSFEGIDERGEPPAPRAGSPPMETTASSHPHAGRIG